MPLSHWETARVRLSFRGAPSNPLSLRSGRSQRACVHWHPALYAKNRRMGHRSLSVRQQNSIWQPIENNWLCPCLQCISRADTDRSSACSAMISWEITCWAGGSIVRLHQCERDLTGGNRKTFLWTEYWSSVAGRLCLVWKEEPKEYVQYRRVIRIGVLGMRL